MCLYRYRAVVLFVVLAFSASRAAALLSPSPNYHRVPYASAAVSSSLKAAKKSSAGDSSSSSPPPPKKRKKRKTVPKSKQQRAKKSVPKKPKQSTKKKTAPAKPRQPTKKRTAVPKPKQQEAKKPTATAAAQTVVDAPFVYPKPRHIDESLLGDLTGGRPGAIIETEEQLAIKEKMMNEMETGERQYPDWIADYGELTQDEQAQDDSGDDPDALDASTLGTWTIQDLRSKFPYEWDPSSGDEPDPNIVEMNRQGVRYLAENEKDSDGVEVGYDPIFGPSNPMDTRSILGAADSYMISETTRNEEMLTPQFPPGDLEVEYNEDVVQFRKSLDIMETYIDPFLPDDMPVPRHVATWHGYPEPVYFTPQNFTNNRFTDPQHKTNFDAMEPYEARRKAVELARAKNAEWMPDEVSKQWHRDQRQPYEDYGTLVGTLRRGECDEAIVQQIQPALNVLGSCVDLLSIDTIDDAHVFRFHYHGLMKNKHGMACWTETLLKDCGAEVTGVVFETGFRRRDAPYDGGDPWYGPSN